MTVVIFTIDKVEAERGTALSVRISIKRLILVHIKILACLNCLFYIHSKVCMLK